MNNEDIVLEADFTPRERNTARLAFESLVSDDLPKLGFFQLANRLLLGLQGRYVLRIFVEYRDAPDHFFLLARSLIDYHYRESIDAFNREFCVQSSSGHWRQTFGCSRRDLTKKMPLVTGRDAYVFPDAAQSMTEVLSSLQEVKGYYFRVDEVAAIDKAKLHCSVSNGEPKRFLERVFYYIEHYYCQMFDMRFSHVMDTAIKEGLPGATLHPKTNFINKSTDENYLEDFFETDMAARDAVEFLYDQEYKKLRNLPINRFSGYPTRVIFHRKVFNRSSVRSKFRGNAGYHFNSELIIPDTQKNDIGLALGKLAGTSGCSVDGRVTLNVDRTFRPGELLTVDRECYGNKDIDDWFWENVVGNPDLFFKILEHPLESHERIFPDSCLVNGVLQYRSDIFDAQKQRTTARPSVFVQTLSDAPEHILSALRRDVCYHYLFCMMATTAEDGPHDMMVVPFRLNGAPFGSISTVFGVRTDAVINYEAEASYTYDNKTFFRNWFFYKNVATSINSDLRRDFLNIFLKNLRQSFRQVMLTSEAGGSVSDIVEGLNAQTDLIQRFLPFEELRFSISNNRREGTVVLPLSVEKRIFLSLHPNKFYSRFGSRPFLSGEICHAEWSAASEEIGELLALAEEIQLNSSTRNLQ